MRSPVRLSKTSRRTVDRARVAAFDQRQSAERVVVRLPVPVSVNDLHEPRAGGGIRISSAYARWKTDAGWRLSEQRPGRIDGRYHLTLRLPRESGCDQDNLLKVVPDLLQDHGVIRNDRLAEETHLYWQDEFSEVVVEVDAAVSSRPSLSQGETRT